MHHCSEAAQNAHSINEGRFGNFELGCGFARGCKLATCLPHQISQTKKQSRSHNVNEALLNLTSPSGHEPIQGVKQYVLAFERDQRQCRKNNHNHE